jgi:hypothetical protein
VFDDGLVAPKIVATDIAKGKPDSWVHGVVIGGVDARSRRVIPRHLQSDRYMDVGKIGPPYDIIAKNIGGHRRSITLDHEPIGVLLHRQGRAVWLGAIGPNYDCHRDQHKKPHISSLKEPPLLKPKK